MTANEQDGEGITGMKRKTMKFLIVVLALHWALNQVRKRLEAKKH